MSRRPLPVLPILVVVVLVGAAVAAPFVVRRVVGEPGGAPVRTTSFAPYVDVTASTPYAFQNDASSHVLLGYVVSSPSVPCAPSWGAKYSLGAASIGIDLDRRIARLRQQGGDVTASFGGPRDDELATRCTDPAGLAAAYRSVVSRYDLTSIDFDLSHDDPAAAARRATAVRAVQAERPVSVWLTLPVTPSGLTAAGLASLDAMLAAKVAVAGVNALTMNFGALQSTDLSQTMTEMTDSALTAVGDQVASAYAAAGIALDGRTRWQHVAATPMIGQNDLPGERFELVDAHALVMFARRHQLAMISMRSANRDRACDVGWTDTTVVSDSCSGLIQDTAAFTGIFNTFAGTRSAPSPPAPVASFDDPATSPYPIWDALTAYPTNAKIVWQRNVYVATWSTENDQPGTTSAWQLIGPVLPGEKPVTGAATSVSYPAWIAIQTYGAGARVQYQGVVYEARRWNVGEQPGSGDPADSPWKALPVK